MSGQPHETEEEPLAYEPEPSKETVDEVSPDAVQRPQEDASATPSAPQAKSQLDPAAESELWSGRASWKCMVPMFSAWLLLTLVVTIGVGVLISDSKAWLVVLVLFGVLGLVLLVRAAWRIWSTSYRLTTQRLFIRRGILTQTVDQTELLRVDDVRLRQTLIQRLLGIGQVQVVSSDRSDADLALRDILTPEAVAEHIRRHTRTVQKRTLFMEQL